LIAKGGRAFVGLSALAAGVSFPFSIVASIAFAGLTVFLALVFRDPGRTIGRGIVSPADGTVREVDEGRRLVSIYLALRNVHVTRSPSDAKIAGVRLSPGTHAPAFSRKTLGNERAELTLDSDAGQITVVEMTGAIARRIVLYVEAGQTLAKGQKLGLIRFGSRVDVLLPPAARITVARGDRVRAGVTEIAGVTDGQRVE
jgi:phosphatidylserine decarboxylase